MTLSDGGSGTPDSTLNRRRRQGVQVDRRTFLTLPLAIGAAALAACTPDTTPGPRPCPIPTEIATAAPAYPSVREQGHRHASVRRVRLQRTGFPESRLVLRLGAGLSAPP